MGSAGLSPSKELVCVAPVYLATVWPIVAPMVDAAYAEMDQQTPDVLPWLIRGAGLLWVLAVTEPHVERPILAAATTSLEPDRVGLACRIVACGGEKADWQACMSVIEAYARAEGCYKIKFDGRRGWGRVLSDYRPICVSFEKRI